MNEQYAKRNVWLYRVYALFNEPLFWGPILIVSLQKLARMHLSDIYYMESSVLCICVLLDIPAGALADMIGRKRTLIIGRIFLFVSAFFFTIMTTPLEAWIGNALWAVGFSLQSGADTALLYDTLKSRARQEEYKRIEGQATGLRLALVGCCSLLSGALASIDLRLPLWIGLPFMAASFFAALFFKEPARTEQHSAQERLAKLKQGALFALRSVRVRWIIGFAALLATTSKLWFFTYNPYFELVHLPLVYYGFIFFCLNIVAWLSSHYAYKVEKTLGERACVIGMALCLGIPILLMGLVPIQPFVYLVLVQNVVRGFMRPFVGGYLNQHIQSDNVRATILSVQSSTANLFGIASLAVFGFLTGAFGLLHSLVLLGVVAIVLGTFSYRVYVNRVA